ncbi:hypothetical protein, partial [Vibrio cholerae]|uniref:hypothetical protein n=1 Tax=Vibrio cholerae TaxID=666 RepID=UPI002095FB59
ALSWGVTGTPTQFGDLGHRCPALLQSSFSSAQRRSVGRRQSVAWSFSYVMKCEIRTRVHY